MIEKPVASGDTTPLKRGREGAGQSGQRAAGDEAPRSARPPIDAERRGNQRRLAQQPRLLAQRPSKSAA